MKTKCCNYLLRYWLTYFGDKCEILIHVTFRQKVQLLYDHELYRFCHKTHINICVYSVNQLPYSFYMSSILNCYPCVEKLKRYFPVHNKAILFDIWESRIKFDGIYVCLSKSIWHNYRLTVHVACPSVVRPSVSMFIYLCVCKFSLSICWC